MISEETQSETPIEDDFISLLKSYKFDTVESLLLALFDFHENVNYRKINQRRSEPLTAQQDKMARIHTYKQLCDLYASRQSLLDEGKRILRHKYYCDDIIRAHQFHRQLWNLCSRARFRILENNSYYQTLQTNDYPQYFRKVIEADVRRTLEEKSEQNQVKLSNVLRAFAKRNPYIGYCQGMNFIVNFLIIMQFDEEEIFWIINSLLEDYLPSNYYTNMLGVAIDLKLIEDFLRLKRPKLFAKLKELSISISIFALEWLVCLFTTVLPYYILVILWDLIFLEGSGVLLKGVIILIDQLEPTILDCKDITQFLMKIEGFKKKVYLEEGQFFMRLKRIFIDRQLLSLARTVYEALMIGDTKTMGKKVNIVHCNLQWPICHQYLQKNKVEQRECDVWVFKEQGPPKMIENYLQTKSKGIRSIRQDYREPQRRLVVGRTHHICSPSAYEIVRGSRANIELSDYDSQTNSYELPVDPALNEISLKFLRSATFINETFIFNGKK